MRLFSPDLLRNFSIGFILGALLIASGNTQNWSHAVASPAQAAELTTQTEAGAAPTAEFLIAPEAR